MSRFCHVQFDNLAFVDLKNRSYKSFLFLQIINLMLVLYFGYMLANMVYAVPENHVSTGVHQETGDCGVMAKDISGHLRQVYLCKENFDEDFSFDCTVGKETSERYTVCGRPHSDKTGWVKAVGLLGALGATTYTRALSPRLYL